MSTNNSSKQATANVENTNTTPKQEGKEEKVEKTNSTSDTSEVTLEETFAQLNEDGKLLLETEEEIKSLEEKISRLKAEKLNYRKSVKPISRARQRFNPNPNAPKILTSIQRQSTLRKIDLLDNQILLCSDELHSKKELFKSRSMTLRGMLREAKTKQRAASTQWTRRNSKSIETRVLNVLNDPHVRKSAEFKALQRLSKSNSVQSKKSFDATLKQLLKNNSTETYLLCNGKAKELVFQKVKLGLKSLSSKSQIRFEANTRM